MEYDRTLYPHAESLHFLFLFTGKCSKELIANRCITTKHEQHLPVVLLLSGQRQKTPEGPPVVPGTMKGTLDS